MSFYDNSPGMVDDIPPPKPASPAPAASAAPAPATTAPAASPATSKASEWLTGSTPRAPATPEQAPGPDVPPSIAELRKADSASSLYTPEGMHGQAVREVFDTWIDPMATAEQRTATFRELANITTDIGASHQDLRNFASYVTQLERNPPTEQQEHDMQVKCGQVLRERYGADADRMADMARRLVARDPRIAEYLNETGLGNHPDVVLRFVELAQSEQGRGRLK